MIIGLIEKRDPGSIETDRALGERARRQSTQFVTAAQAAVSASLHV